MPSTNHKSDLRICFVGDSFVKGTGDPNCLGWVGRMCAAAHKDSHELTCYNLGVRRETSADIRERWQSEVSCRLQAGCEGRIVFSFGVNDTTLENGKPRVPVADSVANAREILSTAQRFYPILMVGPPPVADREQNLSIVRLSGQFALVCKEVNVPYLDIVTPLLASGVWMREVAANDGSHPGTAGYAELARLVQNCPSWSAWFK